MPEPYNYLGLLGGAATLDTGGAVDKALFSQAQTGQADAQTAYLGQEALKTQVAAQRQQTMQRDFQVLSQNPTPAAYQHFMTLYPEAHEGLSKAWELQDAQQKQGTLRTVSDVYARLANKDYEGAIAQLQQHMDAGQQAGEDTSSYPQLIEMIRTNPQGSLALAGAALNAAVGPDKFTEMFHTLHPSEGKTEDQRTYDWELAQFGKDYADRAQMVRDTKLVPAQQGGRVEAAGPTLPGQPSAPPSAAPGGAVSFAMPVPGGTFTSGFGAPRDGGTRSHDGQDIAAPAGTPVTPIAAGTVVAVGHDQRNGNFVRVKHADGTISGYGHLGHVAVQQGMQITADTPLGSVGATGNATGNVLHLTIRQNGKAVDPRPLLGGPKPVRSIQEAQQLPPGTLFVTPDGRVLRRHG
jgi:murein DD-endopeptidase MepM/ murein hydrolase activator NlpD